MIIESNDEAPVPESRNSVTNENSDQEPQELDAATEKRYRRKSLRRQLQDVIDQLGKASKDPHQKPAKRIDALLRQSEVLLRLQAMDIEDRDQTLQDEHTALTAQHAADAQRIQELEAQITALRTHRCEIKTVPDPEHAKTRQHCETLSAALTFLAGVSSHKEQTAIRAIQQLDQSAAVIVCDAVGINYRGYAQYLMTYKTERDLLNVIERADEDADTSLLRFCRAALAVNHNFDTRSPKPNRDIHSVQEELIERERQENADRQATLNIAWRRQMGL